MISLIRKQHKEIVALCSRYRVKTLELFGSAVTDKDFDMKESDLDFLVEFLPLKEGEHADTYFGLKEAIEDLFQRSIDLVMLRAIKNPYFLQAVDRTREMLYAA